MGDANADAGLERLRQVLAGEVLSEIGYEPAEVEFVLAVLCEAKRRGHDWDYAWFTALRNLAPPRTCSPEVRARVDEARAALHEVKPWIRAAYEDEAEPTAEEVERAMAAARRRENRVLGRAKRRALAAAG